MKKNLLQITSFNIKYKFLGRASILTSSNPVSFKNFIKRNKLDIKVTYGDATVLKQ